MRPPGLAYKLQKLPEVAENTDTEMAGEAEAPRRAYGAPPRAPHAPPRPRLEPVDREKVSLSFPLIFYF